MNNEEFQKAVLEKLVTIEQNMATKDDVKRLEAKLEKGIADLVAMSDVTQKEVRSIRSDLRIIEAVTAKNWNDIVELRQAK